MLYDETKSYVYGLDMISQQTESDEEYPLRDALGSMRQLTDQSSAITMFNSYEPYGEIFSSSRSGSSSYGFAGEWTDATGLVHLRARYYSPAVGRFISKDPYSGDSEFPHSFNGYSYANANPLRFFDPSGWISIEEADEADRIRDSLLSVYNVRLERDWGYDYWIMRHIQSANIGTIINCEWGDGDWRNLSELELVQEAVRDVARTLGGGAFPSASKFRAAMNNKIVNVYRRPNLGNAGGWAFGRNIILLDETFSSTTPYAKYTIAHEIGHVWDYLTGFGSLSRGMATIVAKQERVCISPPHYYTSICYSYVNREVYEAAPGNPNWLPKYALSNATEDWAESFASYVYPLYWSGRNYDNLVPGGLRETYVKSRISELR